MPRVSLMPTTRRVAGALACALLAVSAALLTAPGSGASPPPSAPAGPSVQAGPPPASQDAVLQALGVGAVRAEIVLLIDISGSMADNNLYAAVRQDVPAFLRVLAKQDPEDLVGVILFGSPGDDRVTDPGPPNPDIWLPPTPFSQETDFGYAFQLAVTMFQGAQNIKVGGVLLLSDGEVSMPFNDDPAYGSGFTAPGWKKLRGEVLDLRPKMTITGYDVPLTSNPAFVNNQQTALSHVFKPVQTLPYGTTDLSQSLNLAKINILDSKVAAVAAPDSGQGVQVSWDGLRGTNGKPLDLATGHADVSVTVTAATQHVPLYLSGLSVTSAGLPVTMKGTLPAGRVLLPHQRATLHIRLTWTPKADGAAMTGQPRTMRGKLTLNATVSSPFTPTLSSAFGDSTFSAGGLRGPISLLFSASEPVQWNILELILILLGVLVLLASGAAFRARMTGELVLETVDKVSHKFPLRGLPWRSARTGKLIEKPGRITVHGSLRRKGIHVRMRIDPRPPFDAFLAPGEERMDAGIMMRHRPRSSRECSDGVAPGPDEPQTRRFAFTRDKRE